jgi:hypothetical protein
MSAKPAPEEPTALARQQTAAVVVAASPELMVEAIEAYSRLQQTLDRALPNCIMTIQGRHFRKKNYWRAVTTAFNLTVECAAETWTNIDGDWSCDVTYRAMAPNGRAAFGDGSCSFREKRGAQATRHNVRSHAHTRAYNRAVSNLVGFGEVSAEEVERDHPDDHRQERPQERPGRTEASRAPETRGEPAQRDSGPPEAIDAAGFQAYWFARLAESFPPRAEGDPPGLDDQDRHAVQRGLFGKEHLGDLTDEERAKFHRKLRLTDTIALADACNRHVVPF